MGLRHLAAAAAALALSSSVAAQTPASPAAEPVPAAPPSSAAPPASDSAEPAGPAPLAAAAVGQPAPAPRTPLPFAWAMDAGVDLGDQLLLEVRFQDGSKHRIDVNDGTYLQAGGSVLPLAGGRLRTRLTVGLKGTSIKATNGAAELVAIPFEVLEVLTLGDHLRVGAGLHAVPFQRLSSSGYLDGLDVDFDPSLGYTVRAELFFTMGGGHLGGGVRWLQNRVSAGGPTIAARAFGLYLTFDGMTWR